MIQTFSFFAFIQKYTGSSFELKMLSEETPIIPWATVPESQLEWGLFWELGYLDLNPGSFT